MDSHPLSRHRLEPGEKVNQTRRSIDLARDEGKRATPSFGEWMGGKNNMVVEHSGVVE